ncbi:MAG: transposase [Candidatus Symbiodolus clandestinus]
MISQHKRPKYSLNFKQDAAKLVLEKGYSHQQAADSLGISLSAIRRWVRAEKGCPTPLGSKQANLNLLEHEELIKLRKERANLLMEREILKKAAVFFAKENQ